VRRESSDQILQLGDVLTLTWSSQGLQTQTAAAPAPCTTHGANTTHTKEATQYLDMARFFFLFKATGPGKLATMAAETWAQTDLHSAMASAETPFWMTARSSFSMGALLGGPQVHCIARDVLPSQPGLLHELLP